MSVKKLLIKYEEDTPGKLSGSAEVGFNPSQLVIVSSATWEATDPPKQGKEAHPRQTIFQKVEPDTLTVTLFFDTYEMPASGGGSSLRMFSDAVVSGAKTAAGVEQPMPRTSVLEKTAAVQGLTRVRPKLGRPPVCLLTWGTHNIFRGVLTRVSQTITLFMSDGTPVRATLECSFTEVLGSAAFTDVAANASTSTHVVRAGDTLMGLATAYYGDSSKWRKIAASNGIDDPLSMTPGQSITIPPKG
ncbi:MAG TPA: LysM peptidoglycan-binding domain-containing protein [Polyangium sp.]|nr:LysM peptidoglycan-binding domain-containing protein [Polyangium sp.]